jgi:hypothetical protein
MSETDKGYPKAFLDDMNKINIPREKFVEWIYANPRYPFPKKYLRTKPTDHAVDYPNWIRANKYVYKESDGISNSNSSSNSNSNSSSNSNSKRSKHKNSTWFSRPIKMTRNAMLNTAPDKDSDIENKVFLLEYPTMTYRDGYNKLIEIKADKLLVRIENYEDGRFNEITRGFDTKTFQKVTVLFSVKDNKLKPGDTRSFISSWYDRRIIHGNNLRNLQNLVNKIRQDPAIYSEESVAMNRRYKLKFMPIESYMFKHKIEMRDKENFLRTLNKLMDDNGTTINIPIDVWNYIMEFLLDPGPNPRQRLNGGKRTRRVKKN